MKKAIFAAALAAVSMAATAASSVNLVGAATMIGSDIQLVSKGGSAGAAWLLTPVSTTKSFSMDFAFSLKNNGYSPMADGISLAMQDIGTHALGYAGGNVGYTNLKAVGSVIQTYTNNTAGLNTDGNAYHTKAAPVSMGYANLVTGTEHVTYNADTNLLEMTGTLDLDGSIHTISDSKSVDLYFRFGDTVTMGFTGATGSSWADERITSYQVQTATAQPADETPAVQAVPEPETYALMLAGLGALGVVARRRKSL